MWMYVCCIWINQSVSQVLYPVSKKIILRRAKFIFGLCDEPAGWDHDVPQIRSHSPPHCHSTSRPYRPSELYYLSVAYRQGWPPKGPWFQCASSLYAPGSKFIFLYSETKWYLHPLNAFILALLCPKCVCGPRPAGWCGGGGLAAYSRCRPLASIYPSPGNFCLSFCYARQQELL